MSGHKYSVYTDDVKGYCTDLCIKLYDILVHALNPAELLLNMILGPIKVNFVQVLINYLMVNSLPENMQRQLWTLSGLLISLLE